MMDFSRDEGLTMNRRRLVPCAIATGATLAALALFGIANAESRTANSSEELVPRGPYVDFCPTPEQTEAHLIVYGFDYKPMVACTREGEVIPAQGPDVSGAHANERDPVALDREKAFLKSLRRGPDTDGNPATIESVGPDGEDVVILIQTGDPEQFRGMTPAEFAEKVYP